MRKRVRRTAKALWEWCRHNLHEPLKEQYKSLCQKLRGHYQYYGIRSNYQMLEKVLWHAERAWRYWLNRRSRKKTMTNEEFDRLRQTYLLPRPRIVRTI